MPKGIMVIYNNALEFFDLEIGVLAVFGVVFAIFRESRRLVATDCKWLSAMVSRKLTLWRLILLLLVPNFTPNLHHYSILTGRIHHRGKNHVPSWWGSFTGLNTSLLPPSFGLLHLATSLKRWKLVQLSHTPKRI